MEIRIRHIDQSTDENVHFADVKDESELANLIDFIERCGGVYIPIEGDKFVYKTYQIVLKRSSAYVEIIVGEE